MIPKPVIYDGDMGGDDLWAIAMLLAHPDKFALLGIASVFGNVSQPFATQNISNFLHWLGREDIEVIQGSDTPCDGMRPFGDDAYGNGGVGGVILPGSARIIPRVAVEDWYRTLLYSQKMGTTIFATGPATNLARLIEKHPDVKGKIEKIVFMGGGLMPPGDDGSSVILPNGDIRTGNITPYSEFNAYQDPNALNMLLKSGVKIVFMAMDASQHMVLTKERQARLLQIDQSYAPAFHRMLLAVEALDRMKFGLDGPAIHDPNVIIYALRPDLYKSRPLPELAFTEAPPENERRGQAVLTGGGANALWLEGVTDKNEIFELMLESLAVTIGQASGNR
ncbi:MAG TPA: nucleoside hydrolase [Micavibrio sp.]|nr:nucleoside hydrolase [Micavibrio sp.]